MGWMRLNTTISLPTRLLSGYRENGPSEKEGSTTQYVENITTQEYPFQALDIPDSSLPIINPDIVRATKQDPQKLWIVIDDIVYDCTDNIFEHPGGNTVIESFCGENCSWQFWRFHNNAIMQEFARPLRIGQTSGIVNRFKERPRFVGLRKVGMNDDW